MLDSLHMKPSNKISSYNVDFMCYASQLGQGNSILCYYYCQRLFNQIQNPISIQKQGKLTSFQDMYTLAIFFLITTTENVTVNITVQSRWRKKSLSLTLGSKEKLLSLILLQLPKIKQTHLQWPYLPRCYNSKILELVNKWNLVLVNTRELDRCHIQVYLSRNNVPTVKPPPNHTSLPSSQHILQQCCNPPGILSSIAEICYDLKSLEWDSKIALVLSNTRELNRELFYKLIYLIQPYRWSVLITVHPTLNSHVQSMRSTCGVHII